MLCMNSDVYRSAASVMLLRRAEEGYEFLLLHKPRKRDAWQWEEAGLRGCRVVGQSATVYRYEFPASFRRFRPDNIRGQRIAFIVAIADPRAAVQVDGKEVDGFAWVTLPGMLRRIRRRAYRDIVRALYGEAVALLKGARNR